jgi:hypothetical protein
MMHLLSLLVRKEVCYLYMILIKLFGYILIQIYSHNLMLEKFLQIILVTLLLGTRHVW